MATKKGSSLKKNVQKKTFFSKPVKKHPGVYSYKSSSESEDAGSFPSPEKYPIPTSDMNASILPSDLSSILKVGTDPNEEDDLDEIDRPLHSTALEEEQHEISTQSQKISPPKKRLQKRSNLKSTKNADLSAKKLTKPSEKENIQKNAVRKTLLETSAALAVPVPSHALQSFRTNPQSKQLHNKPSDSQDDEEAHTSGNVGHVAKAAMQNEVPKGKKRKVLHENESPSSRDRVHGSNVSVAMWCPDGIQRSSRDITDLDIILAEFTNIIANYKLEVESVTCIKTIDSFFSAVKGQFTKTIEEVQKLKNLQRKNRKVITGIAKARKRMVTVKDEILVAEPQLQQLQKEYIQLQEKMDSLKIARQFLADLKDLKEQYVEYRKKDPKEIERYGVSSLPALLLESRSILSAEKHLHTVNSKLQRFLDQDCATTHTDSETS